MLVGRNAAQIGGYSRLLNLPVRLGCALRSSAGDGEPAYGRGFVSPALRHAWSRFTFSGCELVGRSDGRVRITTQRLSGISGALWDGEVIEKLVDFLRFETHLNKLLIQQNNHL